MLRQTGEESTYHTAACAKIWEVIFLNYQSDPVVLIHAIIPLAVKECHMPVVDTCA